MDNEREQITSDDIDWLDMPYAEEGLMVAGMMIDIIKELGLDEHITREDALLIFDAADIWREALDHIAKNTARRLEINALEEMWELN